MTKVRINDLARELEVKSKPILDALEAIGVSGKTHSSSIDPDQAERVRDYFKNGGRSNGSKSAAAPAKPKFDLSNVSKPGDALKAILERRNAEAAARNAPPPRPAVTVAAPAVSGAPAAASSAVRNSSVASVAPVAAQATLATGQPAVPARRIVMPQPASGREHYHASATAPPRHREQAARRRCRCAPPGWRAGSSCSSAGPSGRGGRPARCCRASSYCASYRETCCFDARRRRCCGRSRRQPSPLKL